MELDGAASIGGLQDQQRPSTPREGDADAQNDPAIHLSFSDLHRSHSWATQDQDNPPVTKSTSTLKRRNSNAKSPSPPLPQQKRQPSDRLPSLHLDPDFAADLSTLRYAGDDNDYENGDTHGVSGASRVAIGAADGVNADSYQSRSIWARMRGLVRGQHQDFHDLHDPVRRKQQGANSSSSCTSSSTSSSSSRRMALTTPATAHLPYRYQALMLSDDQDALPSDIDDVDLLHLLSAERAQMAELTVSVFESTWVFLLLLGILSSLMAWSVDGAVLMLSRLHDRFTASGGGLWLPDYFLHTVFRVIVLLLGVTCTYFVCPNAAGSGIPELRSILGGFPFPNYLRGRTLVAKALGLVCALGSGLSIGKEGPFVHLSCIIAHQLLRIPLFQQIRRSQDLTHHVLAAACAVGVTATFGTPIGGVLFSIEVTTTYYVTSNYWRAFFSSVVGVVVFRQLNSLLQGNNVSLFTTQFDVLPYKSYEMTFFLILAALCGLLAALFVKFYRFVVDIKTSVMEKHIFSRCSAARAYAPFVYAGCVALVFALVEFPVGNFMLLSQREIIDDMFSEGNLTATLDDPTHLLSSFGTQWTSPSLALNLVSYIAVRFFSTAVSATVMVPSGIVTPVFAIGAALGRLFW